MTISQAETRNLHPHGTYCLNFGADGEPPSPPPRAYFERGKLIETVVASLAENPIALIGRIRKRFGGDRQFIRGDEFPASRTKFLSRLLTVTFESPENPTSPRPPLSPSEMLMALDNTESILGPQGPDGENLLSSRGVVSVQQHLSRHYIPHHHCAHGLQIPGVPHAIDRGRAY